MDTGGSSLWSVTSLGRRTLLCKKGSFAHEPGKLASKPHSSMGSAASASLDNRPEEPFPSPTLVLVTVLSQKHRVGQLEHPLSTLQCEGRSPGLLVFYWEPSLNSGHSLRVHLQL